MKKSAFLLFFIFSLCVGSAYANSNVKIFPKPGTVALVFDDGPDPATTLKILQILKKYNIKATFNLIGYYAENYPGIVRKIASQGHSIGNHSLSHLDLTKVNKKAIKYEVGKASRILEGILKRKVYCMQPPYLRTSYIVGETLQQYGLTTMPSPVQSYDYAQIGTRAMINHTVDIARSGSIILLHDTRPRTIAALPMIIQGIKKKGLGFDVICVPKKVG